MERKNPNFIIIALILLNLFTLFKLYSLQSSIDMQSQQNENNINSMRNEIDNIYSNVDAKLKKQASIIDNYNITFGEQLNSNSLTVPVTMTITPKEYSEGLTATIQLNDKNISMQKNGTSFVATADINIFDGFIPKVILEQNGSQKIETIDEYSDLQYKYLLNINGGFDGKETYSSGMYKYDGTISLFIDNEQNTPEKINIVSDVNGNPIKEQQADVTSGHTVKGIKEEVELKAGDKFTLYANVQDKYGINYKYILLINEIDNNGDSIKKRPEWSNGSIAEISDKNGNILYVPDYLTNK